MNSATDTKAQAFHQFIPPGMSSCPKEYKFHAILKAKGLPNSVIAAVLQVPTNKIDKVETLPWFNDLLVIAINLLGLDAHDTLLKSAEEQSIKTLMSLSSNPLMVPSVRKSAATTLLERSRGKPTQTTISAKTVTVDNAKDAYNERQRELVRLETELKNKLGHRADSLL